MSVVDFLVVAVAVFLSSWLARGIGQNTGTLAGTLWMVLPVLSIAVGRSAVDAGTVGIFLAGAVLTFLGWRHHRRARGAATGP
jgi:hypothetical protein